MVDLDRHGERAVLTDRPHHPIQAQKNIGWMSSVLGIESGKLPEAVINIMDLPVMFVHSSSVTGQVRLEPSYCKPLSLFRDIQTMGSVGVSEPAGIQIAIDRGGTFTDVHAIVPGREQDIVLKLLSVDPQNYSDAPTEGIRRILEKALEKPVPRGEPIDVSAVSSIRMGTTIATNALLERKGERSALLITKGFRDLLVIGNQARPDIFDLTVAKPGVLYEKVVEIDERVTLEGFTEDPERKVIDASSDPDLVVGLSKEVVRVMRKPDLEVVRGEIQTLYDQGFRSLSVCFMHSYTYPEHELAVAEIASDMGMSVSISSSLQPMVSQLSPSACATCI